MNNKNNIIASALMLSMTSAVAGNVTISNTFQSGTPASAGEVNQNFTDVKTAVDDNNTRINNNASALSTHESNSSAHHIRYSDIEATSAMGIKDNANALNHDRYSDIDAVSAMGSTSNANPLNHDRYTDIDAVSAMGTTDNANSLNHDRYTDADAITAMGVANDNNTLNHNRYTDSEAISAVESSHGAIGGGLNANTIDGLDSTDFIRPIGDLSLTLTGSVSVSASDTLVYGTGTLFTSELNVGDAISIDGEVFSVVSITDDTNLELNAAHTAGASSATAYTDNALLTIKSGALQEKVAVDKSGNLDISGYMFRKVQRATGLGPSDDTDSGQIVSRVLKVTKQKTNTAIRIGYTDNFRVIGSGSPATCRWEIRVDNVSCPGGSLVYDYFIGDTTHRLHSNQVVGYCEGLTSGIHEIQIWVSEVPLNTAGNCYTGWANSRWTIEAEEVY